VFKEKKQDGKGIHSEMIYLIFTLIITPVQHGVLSLKRILYTVYIYIKIKVY